MCRRMHCGLALRWHQPPLLITLLLNLQIRPDDAFGQQMLMNLEVRPAQKHLSTVQAVHLPTLETCIMDMHHMPAQVC